MQLKPAASSTDTTRSRVRRALSSGNVSEVEQPEIEPPATLIAGGSFQRELQIPVRVLQAAELHIEGEGASLGAGVTAHGTLPGIPDDSRLDRHPALRGGNTRTFRPSSLSTA